MDCRYVNPHVAILHDCHAHARQAVVTFQAEGRARRTRCEVCDSDAITVTLFSFEAGIQFRLWLGAVTGVEVWEGAVTA